jgi:hypothetical protein
MKKIGVFVFGLVLLGLLLAPSAAFAQISSYNADFQVVNLNESAAADITISFYDKSGTVVASVTDSIVAGGSNTYSPLPDSVPVGFDGSVVIASTEPVASITNVKGNTSEYGSSYSSFSGGSNEVSLPLVNRDFYGINTWFNVQNTGSSPTTVTVEYSNKPACNQTALIQPYAAATFEQEPYSCLGSAYNGAAKITTDETSDEVAAVVMQVFGGGLLAYNGFAAGGQEPVFPLVTNNVYGIMTGIQIQNQGSSTSTVRVTYAANPGTGTDCWEEAAIPAGGAGTFSINVFGPGSTTNTTNCTEGQYWIGSASVTTNSAGVNLVGIVNQTNFGSSGSSAYGAFDPGAATSTVVMPLLMDAYNIWTGWSVMNVGSSASVTCSYGGTSISYSFTLGANEAKDVQNINGGTGDPGQTLPANYIGSGTCTAASGGALLGVVNQANQNAGVTDGTLTYESVNN